MVSNPEDELDLLARIPPMTAQRANVRRVQLAATPYLPHCIADSLHNIHTMALESSTMWEPSTLAASSTRDHLG